MGKIESLTEEQEAMFESFVNKWIGIGLSTDESDEDAILEAIPQYYKEGGLEPPDQVIICPSPLAAIYAGALILNDNKEDGLREKAIEVWSARVGTSLWSEYNSWRDFMGYIGVDISELSPAFVLAHNSCYIFPYDKFITISEKPCKILLDQTGELHSENSMAIEWRDGFGFYSLHGIRMCGNEWVCETKAEDLDSEKIMAITNVEQRLMAIKKCGISRILDRLKSKVISEGKLDDSGLIYKLHKVELQGSKEKLFEMKNPSEDKIHYEFVVPECNTIFEADLWRRGYDTFKTMKYEPTNLRA